MRWPCARNRHDRSRQGSRNISRQRVGKQRLQVPWFARRVTMEVMRPAGLNEEPQARPRPPWRRTIATVVPLVLLGLAAWALSREFAHLTAPEIFAALRGWSSLQLLLAATASAGSFVTVAIVEWLGLRWLKADLPAGAVLKVSLIANGLAHSLGAAVLVGAAIRARLYGRRGVDLTTVAAATAYQSVSFGLGLAALLGFGLLVAPSDARHWVGALLVFGVVAYTGACAVVRAPLHLGHRTFRLPSPSHALAQIGLGVLDNALAVAVLWALLPRPAVGFWAFIEAYVVAYVGGAMSGVPGGAGVFEAAVTRLSSDLDRAGLAAALLGFRLLFYVAPLAVSSALLVVEMRDERRLRRSG